MITARMTLGVAMAVVATACSLPFTNGGDRKSACDRIAAQAIQTESASRARDLAAQATECYAELAE